MAIAAVGATVFLASLDHQPLRLSIQLAVVVLAAAGSEVLSSELPMFSVTLAYPLVMSAIILGGPSAAGVVALFSAVTFQDIRNHKPLAVIAFNAGQFTLSACIGGWLYLAAGARYLASGPNTFDSLTASDFPRVLVGMVLAAVAVPVVNVGLTSLGAGLLTGNRFRDVVRSAASLLPSQFILAFVGFLMAQVLSLNLLALPLFAFPLLVARQLYQRYMGLRSAYADTIRSLIGALEAKDPYTRGHSERVSRYASRLGSTLGLDSVALERLEYAALLHDIGKLSVPSSVLTKPGRLKDAEMQSIKEHPKRGASMVARIPPLHDLASIVAQHHERIDGLGYPGGLGGPEISLAAKILSVADSYDAMTTNRSYRQALTPEQAMAELVRGADTQFDLAVVRSFADSNCCGDLSAADCRTTVGGGPGSD
jgi:putative nucleotidyltransferase with HDIG domain